MEERQPKSRKPRPRETDLFEPIRDFFSRAGYDVHGEVRHLDLVAVKDGHMVAVELKVGLTFALLAQCVDRQRFVTDVYLGVPSSSLPPLGSMRTRVLRVIRRLELGLITVDAKTHQVKIVFDPKPFDTKQSQRLAQKQKNALTNEIKGRSLRINIGGSTGVPIMTAYRELSLRILDRLHENSPQAPRNLTGNIDEAKKVQQVLYANHYGWFTHEGPGKYGLSEKGRQLLHKKNNPHGNTQ